MSGLCSACLLATALDEDFDLGIEPAALPAAGKLFGDYRLEEEIGRGGMGVVYRAQQLTLGRTVALKVLLATSYTDSEARYRFSKEAETAAALQHPGIVAIHAIGEQDGSPYLTMRFIDGANLSQLCGGHPIEPIRAAKFVSAIADAVQHAHDHGVFHRDLKPSNILVDKEDRPHITDFGIAKRSDDIFDATLTGQILGSPNYLSPEQAAGNNAAVGPTTDVYGLGAILYYLLTGRAPFAAPSITETFKLVIETDPVAPRLLIPTISDELETVCLKCLEKESLRRYQTAHELALDLQRYLRHEPIMARPPSVGYRLIKFVRRNRLAVTAATAVGVVLMIGTVVSMLLAVRARHAERVAELARSTAVSERARAEDLLTFMLGDLRGQLARVGRLDVLEAVGDKAMAYFASRSAQDLDDVTLARRAKALTQIGEIRMAQARYAEATAAFVEAYDRASALAKRYPKDGDRLFERGQAEYWTGFVHRKCGEFSAANYWLTRYHDTCVELVKLDPSRLAWQSELGDSQHNLAVLRQERGEFPAARTAFLAELATWEKMSKSDPGNLDARFRIADARSWLGGLAVQQGDYTEAMKQYVAQTLQLEQLVQKSPRTAHWRYKLAEALLFETDMYLETGQFDTAAGRLKEARQLLNALVTHDSSNRRWWSAALNAGLKEAMLAWQRGDMATASRLLDDVRPQLENLSGIEPTDRKFVLWLVKAWKAEAQLRLSTGRPDAAFAAAKAVELGDKLILEGRANDADVGECAAACVVSGEIAANAGDQAAAQRHWHRAIEMLSPRLGGSRDRRLLDPAARATELLGRSEESRSIIAQLTTFGYVPVNPWPTADQHVAAARQTPLMQPDK